MSRLRFSFRLFRRFVDMDAIEKELFSPPESVRHMKKLDKAAFTKTITLPALVVPPKSCQAVRKHFHGRLLTCKGLKTIVDGPKPGTKLVLFSPLETPKDEDRDFLSSIGAESTDHSLQLNYDIWPADKILRAVLPSGAEVTSAFESVGHIAHVNLRDSQLEYKRVIGEVLLDKNCPRVRTVVNKTSNIEETYRFFKMELLAGDDDMVATVKENGCTFTFDFSKVYWNSRLHTEHKRIVDLLRPGDVVYDVFAGVGPFAIPAAKRGCVIYANDLNPDSFQYLATNARNNGVLDRVKTFNLDGREFLRKVVEKSSPVSHVIMNLPAMAVDFLDVFSGGLFGENSPMIYCYCFSKAEDVVRDAQVQCERVLGANLDACVHYVRDVAPNKAMMCVQFRLPRQVGAKQENGGEGPPLKKTKH